MSKKTPKKKTPKYTRGEIGKVRVIENFLPPPSQLILREDTVKVTLSLSSRSVEFFKKEAEKLDTSYQQMIRSLLDKYAAQFV